MEAGRQLQRLCAEFGVDALYAFGSRAREAAECVAGGRPLDATVASDLDVGVLPGPCRGLSAPDRVRLTQALEALFGVARVDLVVASEAPPFLALSIVEGELLACLASDREAEFQLYVLRRAGDLAPFERERRAALLGIGP